MQRTWQHEVVDVLLPPGATHARRQRRVAHGRRRKAVALHVAPLRRRQVLQQPHGAQRRDGAPQRVPAQHKALALAVRVQVQALNRHRARAAQEAAVRGGGAGVHLACASHFLKVVPHHLLRCEMIESTGVWVVACGRRVAGCLQSSVFEP